MIAVGATHTGATRVTAGASAWMRPFDELEIGDAYVSMRRTITDTDVVAFAALSGEMNPAHGQPERYAPGADGRAVAHEVLPMTYSFGLVPNIYVAALRRVLDVEPLLPVRVGDTIHAEAKIVGLASWTDDHGLVTGAWSVVDQDDAVAMTLRVEVVWRRARI